MTYDISVKGQTYHLFDGQRFYHNNFSTREGHCLPDYIILDGLKLARDGDEVYHFLIGHYENHFIYTKERILSDIILADSNLNPQCKDPAWIFQESSQKLQTT